MEHIHTIRPTKTLCMIHIISNPPIKQKQKKKHIHMKSMEIRKHVRAIVRRLDQMNKLS